MIGTVTGLHKSPHKGASVEFAEYRKYVPGDDIRRLDWRVYARTDRFYVKEFEADTNLRCYLALDCSGSMGFSSDGKTSKLDYARKLAATLAYLAIQQGDAVGVHCLSGDSVVDIPPRRNPTHLKVIFDVMQRAKPAGKTNLLPLLHELAEKIRQRAIVIVFSDFFCDLRQLISCFQHLRFQKHDLAIFHLIDPQEIEFPFEHPTRFIDMEDPMSLLTEPNVIKRQYLKNLDEFLNGISVGCRQFNVDYRRVITNQSYEKVLADFLLERNNK
jgi:uncharacterized protein (DUF58 family)